MRFETRQLADLHPAEYNPRVTLEPGDLEYEQIRSSISEFGYADPIVINSDGTIIKGHQRRNVMLDMGFTEADVIVLDIQDKAKEKALNVALNKITGKWDMDLLKGLLQDLDLEGYDFSVTGFHQDDLADMIQLIDVPDVAIDDEFDTDAAVEEITEPISKTGDIWKLGRHRVMCGDATNPSDVAALLDGALMNLIITDPPYNVGYTEKAKNRGRGGTLNTTRQHNEIANDQMDAVDFYEFLLKAFQNYRDNMQEGAAIYVFYADAAGVEFRRAFADAGLKLSQTLIWEKNTFVLGRQDYQWKHEPILYGWKEGAAHFFVNDRTQDTILYEDKPSRSNLHPTMKPIPLVGRMMVNSSRPNWLIGDFFGGSGTTLIAAEQLRRTAYTMEMDPVYVDVIVKRWEQLTGERAVKL